MSDEKEEVCTIACNHLRFLVKGRFYGEYVLKMKDGMIYHAAENKSLKFGGTERGNNGNDKSKD